MYVTMYTCMYVFHTDEYDCATAVVNVTEHYHELLYLSINPMLSKLFSKGAMFQEEYLKIKAIPAEINRMEYFLDHIILPSLQVGYDKRFRIFFELMNQSGDSTLISMAAKLGK